MIKTKRMEYILSDSKSETFTNYNLFSDSKSINVLNQNQKIFVDYMAVCLSRL